MAKPPYHIPAAEWPGKGLDDADGYLDFLRDVYCVVAVDERGKRRPLIRTSGLPTTIAGPIVPIAAYGGITGAEPTFAIVNSGGGTLSVGPAIRNLGALQSRASVGGALWTEYTTPPLVEPFAGSALAGAGGDLAATQVLASAGAGKKWELLSWYMESEAGAAVDKLVTVDEAGVNTLLALKSGVPVSCPDLLNRQTTAATALTISAAAAVLVGNSRVTWRGLARRV